MSAGAGFDFSSLTEAQQQLLTAGGWDLGRGKQPRAATVRKLIERGLVVARERSFMGVRITAYDVPAPIGIAWREHRAAAGAVA